MIDPAIKTQNTKTKLWKKKWPMLKILLCKFKGNDHQPCFQQCTGRGEHGEFMYEEM